MVNRAPSINGDTVNGRTVQIHITTHGSDWYWTVTAVMVVSTMIILGLGFTKPRTHRIFHYITAAITLVAAIAYFTMASNLGWTPINVEWRRSGDVAGVNRQIFYARYIDWFITTPLLLFDILLTAGLPWPTLLYTVLMDWIMVISGLIGALVQSTYKWGYYVFGCAALIQIAWTVVFIGRKHAYALGSDVHRTYLICGCWTMFLWLLYPICWGLCEGGNVISPDSEAVFYGILDILAKPVFGALLLWGHRNIDPGRMGLTIRDYEEGASTAAPGVAATRSGGRFSFAHRGHKEKAAEGTNGVGHTNGVNEPTPGATTGANGTTGTTQTPEQAV
ncbi:family A G protein-coupled receptor-like protein [Xylona heveae TC161]|uniref:Family A G protein-coupled receptor-like protein n=1 Tax=Xylona heveae (strain CBS 132557 / TC161) TaxID=1328760 RepID=A0A165AH23_XYLHT|nr:family A G protein-coupled receptor-like protein [Xylona heveae TC161]KZF20459.1 family A G protein-coupled receptor-like protein [Xylona heveae TC161]